METQPVDLAVAPAYAPPMTHPTRINDILALLTPEEIQDALWMIDVWEQWDMPAEEAAEWRRRILAHVEYVALSETKQSAQ